MKNLASKVKTYKGITLIALVVTIVVLVILGGTSLALVLKNNGLINRTKEASELTQREKAKEEAILAYQFVLIDSQGQLKEDTLGSLVVARMKKIGYNIKDITTTEEGITEINIDKNTLKINKGETGIISITNQEAAVNNTKYFMEIEGKYYELIIKKNKIEIDENAVDIENYEGNQSNEITVISENESIATVEKTGNSIIVTPVSIGTTKIVIKAGNLEKVCDVTITNIIKEVVLDSTVGEIVQGESITIKATINPEAAEGELIWEISTPENGTAIATINATGTHKEELTVNGLTGGTAKIYCKNEEGTILGEYTLTVLDLYTITYELNGGTNNSNNPSSYTVKSPSITLQKPQKSGYIFAGWTGSNGDTKQQTVTIEEGSTGNKNYVANWDSYISSWNVYRSAANKTKIKTVSGLSISDSSVGTSYGWHITTTAAIPNGATVKVVWGSGQTGWRRIWLTSDNVLGNWEDKGISKSSTSSGTLTQTIKNTSGENLYLVVYSEKNYSATVEVY